MERRADKYQGSCNGSSSYTMMHYLCLAHRLGYSAACIFIAVTRGGQADDSRPAAPYGAKMDVVSSNALPLPKEFEVFLFKVADDNILPSCLLHCRANGLDWFVSQFRESQVSTYLAKRRKFLSPRHWLFACLDVVDLFCDQADQTIFISSTHTRNSLVFETKKNQCKDRTPAKCPRVTFNVLTCWVSSPSMQRFMCADRVLLRSNAVLAAETSKTQMQQSEYAVSKVQPSNAFDADDLGLVWL